MTPPPIPPINEAPRRMLVRYSLTRWDIVRWQIYSIIRNRFLIGFGLVVSLGVVWHDLGAPDMAARPIGFKIFYIVFFTALMFCIIGSVQMVLLVCLVMFKKHRGILGEHELEIRDDGLVERTNLNESLHRWARFQKVITTRRYLFIHVTDTGAHVVPRRYFASEQEQKAFQNEIQRRINGS